MKYRLRKINFEIIGRGIANLQMKKPWFIIIFFIIITLALAPGIALLLENVEPSLEKVLPQDIDEVKNMNYMREQFGADMMYVLVYASDSVDDIRDPNVINYIDLISQKIRNQENILQVNSIADIVKSHSGYIPQSLDEIKDITKDANSFINYDSSFTVIRIRADTGADAQVISKVVNSIESDIESLQDYNPGTYSQVTGFNAIDKATFEVIINDFVKITFISMILVMLVVFFTFRSFVKASLPMVVVMVALIWTLGLAGYFSLTLTVVSMVAAAMIMGLGIDFGIHVVHSYFENTTKMDKPEALRETLEELLRAMIAASLTTTAGFLALLFGVLPAMKTLGIILAIGIISTLINAIFLLPTLTYIYDTRGTK